MDPEEVEDADGSEEEEIIELSFIEKKLKPLVKIGN